MRNSETKKPSKSEVELLFNLYNSGNLVEAENHCKTLLNTYPDSALVSNMLGVVFLAQGKPTQALSAYENTIQKNPDYPDVYNNLGILLNSLGQFDEAIEKIYKSCRIRSRLWRCSQ